MKANEEQRTAERLMMNGMDSMSTTDLLALALSPGSSQAAAHARAERLLAEVGSVRNLSGSSIAELKKASLSEKQALALKAAFLLARRAGGRLLPRSRSFHSSLEIFRYFQPVVRDLLKECFWAILMDGKNRILKVVRVSEGSLTRAIVHPREVYRPAIREAAAGILFVHNHPSGDPAPSQEDIQITQRLVETGKVVGIRVLDHVIIGSYRYFSFADKGML